MRKLVFVCSMLLLFLPMNILIRAWCWPGTVSYYPQSQNRLEFTKLVVKLLLFVPSNVISASIPLMTPWGDRGKRGDKINNHWDPSGNIIIFYSNFPYNLHYRISPITFYIKLIMFNSNIIAESSAFISKNQEIELFNDMKPDLEPTYVKWESFTQTNGLCLRAISSNKSGGNFSSNQRDLENFM